MESSSVSATTVACLRCAQRKQRCTRELPVCAQCAKAGAECYSGKNETSMRRTADGTVQTKSYIAHLHDRIKNLEKTLQQRESQHAQLGHQVTPTGIVNTANSLHTTELSQRQATPGAELAQLPLSAMGEPQLCSRTGPSVLAGVSMPIIIDALTRTYGGDPSTTAHADPLWSSISKDIRRGVPERLQLTEQQGLEYVDRYFELVDYRYPRLPREWVTQGISAITSESHHEYIEMITENPARIFVAYLVIAITPLVSDSCPVSQASFVSIHVLTKALKLLVPVFELEDGVEIIHCLRLLVIFSLHSAAAGSSWHLVGIAMKKCVALGFHKEVRNPSASPLELDQRRWAFWSCYLLDRIISGALDRPGSIALLDVTTHLPGTNIPNHSLMPSELRQIHLFRYACVNARLLDRKDPLPISLSRSQLFHLQSTIPMFLEPYPRDQREHFDSLCNTLFLRSLVNKLLLVRLGEQYSQEPDPPGSNVVEQISNRSCALVSSLNRSAMRSRSVLSFTTGYSAVLAGLAQLYSFSFLDTSVAWDEMTVQQHHSAISVLLEVLSVVSRQFPTFQAWKSTLLAFERAIDPHSSAWSVSSPETIILGTWVRPSNGPVYLQDLAELVAERLNLTPT